MKNEYSQNRAYRRSLSISEYTKLPTNWTLASGVGSYPEIDKTADIRWIASKLSNGKWCIRYGVVKENVETIRFSGKLLRDAALIAELVAGDEEVCNLYNFEEPDYDQD